MKHPRIRKDLFRLAAGLFLAFGTALFPTTPAGATPGAFPVRSARGITEYLLPNGLRVLLYPEPSKPQVTVVATYLVGSRFEGPGERGMTHMLEHSLGKGTENFESIWTALADKGADFNGTTWFDRTNFWETLPASEENLDFLLRIEADRMSRALIDSAELAIEMGTITNELEMMESDPRTILSNQMMATAYLWHDYRHPAIGNRSDIRRYPIGGLRAFYRRHYRPDNTVLFVGGRIEPARALALVEKVFGGLRAPDTPIDRPSTEEPPQDGPRSVTIPWIGDIAAAGAVYHVPAAAHPDAAAVSVLSEILTGPAGRLAQRLVDTGLAAAIDDGQSDALLLAEPGVLEVDAQAVAGGDPRTLLDSLVHAVEGFDEATERETEVAKARLLRARREKGADAASFGVDLSEWIASGDWRLLFLYEERLRHVAAEDVTRVARKYLRASNRTTGLVVPATLLDPVAVPPAPDLASDLAAFDGMPAPEAGEVFDGSPEAIAERALRLRIEPGTEIVLVEKKHRDRSAHVTIRIPYGTESSLTGHREALRMLPDLLLQGAAGRNHRELADAIDLTQSKFDFGGIEGTLRLSIDSDRDHLPEAIRLAGEILREPTFDAERFATVREARRTEFEGMKNDPIQRTMNQVRRGLYSWPEESIHYMPTLEERIEALGRTTVEEVRALYAGQVGASRASVAVVGDFDKGEVTRALADAFRDWASPAPYERIATPYRPVRSGEQVVRTPGNPMAVIVRATLLEVRDDDPDYPALELAAQVFCEGARPRIAERLRHEEGLSYYASGALDADRLDRSASFYAFALCSPDVADRAFAAMDGEFHRWTSEGVTEEELREVKEGMLREAEREFADDDYLARELASLGEAGRDIKYHADLRKKIEDATKDEVDDAIRRYFAHADWLDVRAGDFPPAP